MDQKDDETGETIAYPDTLVGTDSHTTMVNGLAVLGWGVGGIEAEAAMLGQPITMLIPEVVGFKMTGRINEGITATDLVLTVTEMLRKKGVVGKFVEFYGPGLDWLSPRGPGDDRQHGARIRRDLRLLPGRRDTLAYLETSGRDASRVALVEAYSEAQGMFRDDRTRPTRSSPTRSSSTSRRSCPRCRARSGRRTASRSRCGAEIRARRSRTSPAAARSAPSCRPRSARAAMSMKAPPASTISPRKPRSPVKGESYGIDDGDVVIAAITSCTNTSNPSVLIAAGLVARKARALGLKVKPWVKTSLAPGSQVVTDYLNAAGLSADLDALGFNLVGYGCTTCIGNSGPLPTAISECINDNDLVAASVLSGNRNFEGRVNPDVRANYLASPPLVVAYALAGSLNVNVATEPLGTDKRRQAGLSARHLADQPGDRRDRPQGDHAADVPRPLFRRVQGRRATGRAIAVEGGETYRWNSGSTYVQNPPYFEGMSMTPEPVTDIKNARILGALPRLDHHRPHLAGRLVQGQHAGRPISGRAAGGAEATSTPTARAAATTK